MGFSSNRLQGGQRELKGQEMEGREGMTDSILVYLTFPSSSFIFQSVLSYSCNILSSLLLSSPLSTLYFFVLVCECVFHFLQLVRESEIACGGIIGELEAI